MLIYTAYNSDFLRWGSQWIVDSPMQNISLSISGTSSTVLPRHFEKAHRADGKTLVLQTRYRDIPFGRAINFLSPGGAGDFNE